MGTQLVVEGLDEVAAATAFVEVAAAGGQVYTESEVLGGGIAGPAGGFLDLHPETWQLGPGQEDAQ
jgi:hypothetical protein